MKKTDPRQIETNAIQLIGREWMLITAGTPDRFNAMTASWGTLGELWHKPVAFVFVRPQRYTYEFMENGDTVTLSFFGEDYREALKICGSTSGRDTDKIAAAGLTTFNTEGGGVSYEEASLVLDCRKLYSDSLKPEEFTDASIIGEIYPHEDFHKMYILEITGAWVR